MNTFNRNVSKITAATLLALTLAACGGGGGGSQSLSTDSTPTKDNKVVSVSAQKEQAIGELEEAYDVKVDSYSVKINGKTYKSGNIDLSGLGEGVQRIKITEEATGTTAEGSKGKAVRDSILHIYQQPYSIVAGVEVKGGTVTAPGFRETLDAEDVDFDTVRGYATQTLPSSGKFNYVGEALSQEQTGKFNYTVDFTAKTGSGSITDIADGITLHEGQIGKMSHTNPDNTVVSGYGIGSSARSNSGLSGTYKLGFFGPNADEVAGVVTSHYGDVGFGGKKQ